MRNILPDILTDNTSVLHIDCISLERTVRFIYWKGKDSNDERIYVTIHLSSFPIWKRFIYALKYFFGFHSIFGAYEEVVIDHTKAKQLIKLFSKLEQKQ